MAVPVIVAVVAVDLAAHLTTGPGGAVDVHVRRTCAHCRDQLRDLAGVHALRARRCGVDGLVSFGVIQRIREFAIRCALGATATDIGPARGASAHRARRRRPRDGPHVRRARRQAPQPVSRRRAPDGSACADGIDCAGRRLGVFSQASSRHAVRREWPRWLRFVMGKRSVGDGAVPRALVSRGRKCDAMAHDPDRWTRPGRPWRVPAPSRSRSPRRRRRPPTPGRCRRHPAASRASG